MKKYPVIIVTFLVFFSCKSVPKESTDFILDTKIPVSERNIFEAPRVYQPENEELTLIFAGDIMAHTPNYNMKNYDKIWNGISDITTKSDFTFGNIEAPVAEKLPKSSYPSFNFHEDYIDAAIKAGFNVFSLANNHTNDQYKTGILQTIEFAEKKEKSSANTERPIYFSGLKDGKKSEFNYRIIEKNGWKILFVAVTQLLNRNDDSEYINYVPSKKEAKNDFIKWIKKVKSENTCDYFILSLHTNEEEYIRQVTKKQRNWYNELMDAGVDILWANHAHLIKHQEKIWLPENNRYPKKLLMCANGNTISAQRKAPNLDLSFTERDDTGDGLLYKVILRKTPDSKEAFIYKTERYFITTDINTAGEYILKKLDDDFINYLKENRKSWVPYIQARKKICEEIKD